MDNNIKKFPIENPLQHGAINGVHSKKALYHVIIVIYNRYDVI